MEDTAKLINDQVDLAVKKEVDTIVEYIRDAYGDTEVGQKIIHDLTTKIELEPLPLAPWEKGGR